MQMPEMDGVQLADTIRPYRPAAALPLILLTSLGRRAEDIGADRFAACLSKPVKPSQLYDTLIGIVDRSATPNAIVVSHLTIDTSMAKRLPLRLLLAEDNLVNQKVALRTLDRMGYRANVAANGLEVLAALERQRYDVILMHVQMPELDGLEPSRRIHRDLPPNQRPQIIAMTANAMQGDRELCLDAGMDDYISKPVRAADLTAALERSVQRARTRAGATQANAAIVGQAVLKCWQADLGDDSTIVVELIDLFLEDTPQLLKQMKQAVADVDIVVLRRTARTLKSSSGTVGAQKLAAYCAELEQLTHSDVLGMAAMYCAQIESAYIQAAHVLVEMRANTVDAQLVAAP
jgi:CheY-like chemotaxis protein/HPt (histidine-containing phosphotransfer) domain-containing protein